MGSPKIVKRTTPMVAKKAVKKSAPPPKKKAPVKASKDVKPAKKEEKPKSPPKTAGSAKPLLKFAKPPTKEKPASASPAGKVSKAELAANGPLGKKFTCYSCSTKFYDLNKPEKKCPKCGADQLAKPAIKSRMAAIRQSEYDVEDEEDPVVEEELLEETEELEEAEDDTPAAEEEEA